MTERLPPAAILTRDDLGAALTGLRLDAGLTVRQLAARAGLPSATVGGYVTARHLPGPAQLEQFRAVLAACGVADGADQQDWIEAVRRVRRASDGRAARRGAEGRAPYRGLEAFQPDDAELFFGRDAFTRLLLARLVRLSRAEVTPRLLFVLGASGSGKSSVLRAGLYPAIVTGTALAQPDGTAWHAHILTPGAQAAADLAAALRDVPEPRVLVIDQFEELYTLTTDESERAEFVDLLLGTGERTIVVAGMRADFYASAARDPRLVPALQDWQLVVPPMSADELRAVIVGPATARRIAVDDELVDTVLADVFPQMSGTLRHNALPLLSHALLAAWQHRRRGPLTVQDYRGTGGLAGAVQQSAEDAYSELDAAGQDVCRRLFLRLITVDDDLLTTRRRVDRSELGEREVAVAERFVARRLITVDDQSVEISHEALLAAWPRLAEWIAADHESLQLHRRLTGAANRWQDAEFDDHLLLRGTQLSAVEDWAADRDHRADMNRLERDYLTASQYTHHVEVRTGRRRAAVLRAVVVALAVLLLVAIGTTVFAIHASRVADRQRAAANAERDAALSREVAIESQRSASTDLALAAQLGVTAVTISPTVDARSALLDSVAGGVVSRVVGPSGPTTIARNRSGTLIAISNAADGSVALHRAVGGRPGPTVSTIPALSPSAQVFALAFDPVGNRLAIAGLGGAVRLVDVTDAAQPVVDAKLPGPLAVGVQGLAFTPSGSELFAGGGAPGIRRWDLSDPHAPTLLPQVAGLPHDSTVQSIAVSPDGAELEAGTTAGAVLSWRTSALDAKPRSVQLAPSAVDFLAFAPDGTQLVAGTKDARVSVLAVDATRLTVGHRLTTDFTSWANTGSYAPDGRYVAIGSADGKIDIFDTERWTTVRSITSSAQVTALDYDPAGAMLNAASADGVVRTFPTLGAAISGLGGPVFAIGMSGNRLAASSTNASGAVSIWSTSTHSTPRFVRTGTLAAPPSFGTPDGTVGLSRNGHVVAAGNAAGKVVVATVSSSGAVADPVVLAAGSKVIESVAVNAAGTLVAAGSDDGKVRLWDVSDPAHPRSLPSMPAGGEVACVAFSPNGRFVAGASVDHKVHVWDVRTPSAPTPVATLGGFGNYAWSVAFSPDSRIVAGGGADNSIRLWDLSDPAHPRLLGTPFTGPTHYVFSLAFSPDGKTLAATGGDSSVWTWSVADPAHPVVETTLHAADPGGGTYTSAFTPDGSHLAAAGSSGQVTFWDTRVDAAVQTVCRLRGTPITRTEWAADVPGVSYRDPCR